jgi:hypothetical protein
MQYSPRNFWLLTGLGLAAIIAAHLLPHAVRGNGLWSVPALGFGLLMVLAFVFGGLRYGALDDIQRQNIKSDWYWGCLIGFGLLCGLVFPFIMFGGGVERLGGMTHMGETPKGYFFSGVMITLACTVAGVALAWIHRRLREMKS